jgi:hypothetical protein
MNKQLITIVLLATFSLSAQAKEDFYKWVDDKGVTHYSQSPPEDNVKTKTKAETVTVSTHQPVGSDAAISQLAEKRTEVAKAKESGKEGVKKTGEKAAPDVSKAPAQYKEKCAKLKQDAQSLVEKGNRILVKDEKGETHKLTEEEVNKRIDETKRNIKAYCE